MVDIKNVTRIFKSFEVETRALNDVTLRVDEGDFIAIMGQSGCGKSTLLHILGLLDEPDHGQYIFNG
ncbi:MAG: ATP-binding cassette domain-containing protein, partial [Bacteroidetes bacterium]|nr:ATP-binding cassette domain-containing protein [Bacteroidota bacterium]